MKPTRRAPLRLLFVNHAHPDIPHVSGMRLSFFAREMARRGHEVVLLTCALSGTGDDNTVDPTSAPFLQNHDWTRPLVVPVPARTFGILHAAVQAPWLAPARRAMTAWRFVRHGGVLTEWQIPATSLGRRLATSFQPDLVWATFGNTSNLALARDIAREARCAWVMDIKDNWEAFIPGTFRRWLAWRFRSAAGWTSNAMHHQRIAAKWLGQTRSKIIYSGVADTFFDQQTPDAFPEVRDLVLVGSTYDKTVLKSWLLVLNEWLASLPSSERQRVRFVYAGADADKVRDATREVPLICTSQIFDYLPGPELAKLARAAFANCYLTASFTFHHKLLELLACGRPVVCFPSDHDEARQLATASTTRFSSCATTAELRDAIAAAWTGRNLHADASQAPRWRWADFADDLEQFFHAVLNRPLHQ